MLQALTRIFSTGQLELGLQDAPRNADELLIRLRRLGLRRSERLTLTRNRTVMVSFRATELRVHEGFLAADEKVLRAIVAFVEGRTRRERRAAQHVITSVPIAVAPPRPRRVENHPADAAAALRLTALHRELNARYFAGMLGEIPIRVSRRMKSRLGHYSLALPTGEPAEIAIGRRHLRRHGWDEATGTLLHEMVHQWQDESGLPIDHGRAFRRKAREVGIVPSARRRLS